MVLPSQVRMIFAVSVQRFKSGLFWKVFGPAPWVEGAGRGGDVFPPRISPFAAQSFEIRGAGPI